MLNRIQKEAKVINEMISPTSISTSELETMSDDEKYLLQAMKAWKVWRGVNADLKDKECKAWIDDTLKRYRDKGMTVDEMEAAAKEQIKSLDKGEKKEKEDKPAVAKGTESTETKPVKFDESVETEPDMVVETSKAIKPSKEYADDGIKRIKKLIKDGKSKKEIIAWFEKEFPSFSIDYINGIWDAYVEHKKGLKESTIDDFDAMYNRGVADGLTISKDDFRNVMFDMKSNPEYRYWYMQNKWHLQPFDQKIAARLFNQSFQAAQTESVSHYLESLILEETEASIEKDKLYANIAKLKGKIKPEDKKNLQSVYTLIMKPILENELVKWLHDRKYTINLNQTKASPKMKDYPVELLTDIMNDSFVVFEKLIQDALKMIPADKTFQKSQLVDSFTKNIIAPVITAIESL